MLLTYNDLLQKRTLSGFALKRVAVASMLIDHLSFLIKALLSTIAVDGMITFTAQTPAYLRFLPQLREICEALGSVAFPLFCFLVSEGFIHTRSPLRYGALLGGFALISEIPFNLAHYGKCFNASLQNVLFTLCVSVFALCAIKAALTSPKIKKAAARYAVCALVAALSMALARLIRSEYVYLGVASVLLFYLLRDKGALRLLGVAPLLAASPWVLLCAPFILFYGGKRGNSSKYFFYIFYPAHFLVIFALVRLIAQ